MVATRARGRANAWRREVDDLLRGLSGGLLFGIPLLYTMETWWIGETISPLRALILLAIAYALNLAFVTWAGFRRQEAGSKRPFGDALEATAIALVTAAVILVLLHQLQTDHPLGVIVGRLAVNAVPISLGIGIANHILGTGASRTVPGTGEQGDQGGERPTPRDGVHATLLDLGASSAGALFLSFNIAPTEEVSMLAAEVPTLFLPAIVLASLLLTYAIVFVAGFGGQEQRAASTGLFQHPVTETVAAYLTSLATCVGVLWLFDQIGADTDPFVAYAKVIILGVPAAIGAAAGRLAV